MKRKITIGILLLMAGTLNGCTPTEEIIIQGAIMNRIDGGGGGGGSDGWADASWMCWPFDC